MIGTGYVGLVSGACFADFGHRVTCVDTDAGKIAALNRGEIPIFEPGLDDLVATSVKAGRLDFTTDLAGPVGEADAVFIAVGTPSRRGDGHADLTYVHAAARDIAKALQGFTVVVTGASTGLGRAIAVEVARRGAALVVVNYARSAGEAEETARLVEAEGGKAALVQGDVAVDEDCRKIVAAAAATGRIDALFNNAGVTKFAPNHADLDAVDADDFLRGYPLNPGAVLT